MLYAKLLIDDMVERERAPLTEPRAQGSRSDRTDILRRCKPLPELPAIP